MAEPAERREQLADQHDLAAARHLASARYWEQRDRRRAELDRRSHQLAIQAAAIERDRAQLARDQHPAG